MVDARSALPFDSEQVVVPLAVGSHYTHACLDTGACRTLISVSMAQALSLPVTYAAGDDCGSFQVPGASTALHYAGKVDGPINVTLGPGVVFALSGLRVVHHPYPMLLLGGDILRGGRGTGHWNFAGLHTRTVGAASVEGYLSFTRDSEEVHCPCFHCPAEGTQPFAYVRREDVAANASTPRYWPGATPVNLVGGPPLGGARGECIFRLPQ